MRESDLLARLDVEPGRDRRSHFAGGGLRGEGDLDLAVVQRELLDRGVALVAGVLITGDHDVGQFVLQELTRRALARCPRTRQQRRLDVRARSAREEQLGRRLADPRHEVEVLERGLARTTAAGTATAGT